MMHTVIDMTGKKIGWWTVLERTDPPPHVASGLKRAWWLCRCRCGTERAIAGGNLRRGDSNSCGCRCYKRNSIHANTKTKFPKRHNLKSAPFYVAWTHMLLKCYNKDFITYKNYGAKGITVCDEWRRVKNFALWANDNWKPNHCIELKEGKAIFSPENCYLVPKGDKISTVMRKRRAPEYGDLLGKQFGGLNTISEEMIVERNGHRRTKIKCLCNCGKTTLVYPHSLVNGITTTCGCRRKFEWSKDFKECVVCHCVDSRHACRGVCFRCYRRERDKKNKEKQCKRVN